MSARFHPRGRIVQQGSFRARRSTRTDLVLVGYVNEFVCDSMGVAQSHVPHVGPTGESNAYASCSLRPLLRALHLCLRRRSL